jgi:hypothetical protein
MDCKPEGWTGTCEDQIELFVEILAYLLEREMSDVCRGCYSVQQYRRMVPDMLKAGFYSAAHAKFKTFLQDWGVAYLAESGVHDEKLNDTDLPRKLYCARMLAKIPNGKVKKYADVYENLE